MLTKMPTLLALVLFFLAATGKTPNYCEINFNHSLCDPSDMLTVPVCGYRTLYYPRKDEQRDKILDEFNAFRNKVAGGSLKMDQDSFPPASNMIQLEYCRKCEQAAWKFLRHCEFHNDIQARPKCCNCLNTGDIEIFPVAFTYKELYHVTFDSFSILDNMLQIKEQNRSSEKVKENLTMSLLEEDKAWLAFSAHLTRFGCASISFSTGDQNNKHWRVIVMCYFGSFPRDTLNNMVYREGDSCSNCPPGTRCSTKFKNLCECTEPSGCHTKSPSLDSKCDILGGSSQEVPIPKGRLGLPSHRSSVNKKNGSSLQKTSLSAPSPTKNLAFNFENSESKNNLNDPSLLVDEIEPYGSKQFLEETPTKLQLKRLTGKGKDDHQGKADEVSKNFGIYLNFNLYIALFSWVAMFNL